MAGYVTSGTDGLHYDKPKKWTFDYGANLGNTIHNSIGLRTWRNRTRWFRIEYQA